MLLKMWLTGLHLLLRVDQRDLRRKIRCPFYQHFTCHFFVQKCYAQLFSNYSFTLLFFWRKNIGAKVARKMLVKLTTAFPAWARITVTVNHLLVVMNSSLNFVIYCKVRIHSIIHSVPRIVALITVHANMGARNYICVLAHAHTIFFTHLKQYFKVCALFFWNFYGWGLKSTN